MTLPACRDLDPLEGELKNDCGPKDCDPYRQYCSTASIDMPRTAEAETVPCKRYMWLRVGLVQNPT
jgi:hypothetical protein